MNNEYLYATPRVIKLKNSRDRKTITWDIKKKKIGNTYLGP